MAGKKTELIRTDPQMKEFIRSLQAKKFMTSKRLITTARITKGMYNQYMKYPELVRELEKADMK